MTNKTIKEALDEIKIAFDNFCIDAEAIINEAKERTTSCGRKQEVKSGRNKNSPEQHGK